MLCMTSMGLWAQDHTDVHRKYLYGIDHQLTTINGMSIGMLQLATLQNNGVRSYSAERILTANWALENNATTTDIRNIIVQNAATLGYNNWTGTTLQGNYNSKTFKNQRLNVSVSANTADNMRSVAGRDVLNKSNGGMLSANYYYAKKKFSVSSNLELTKDVRQYDSEDALLKLHTNHNYGHWNNNFSYQINNNTKLSATANILGYFGSVKTNDFQYEGSQSLSTLRTTLAQQFRKFSMQNSVTYQRLQDNNVFSRTQNRWEWSNSLSPRIKNKNTKLQLRNSIVHTDSTSFFYAPQLAYSHTKEKISIKASANRFMRTQTNDVEMWPYFTYADNGIRNVTGEQVQTHVAYNLNHEISLYQLLRYEQFTDFKLAGESLRSMARASLGILRRKDRKWNYSGVYHYRFLGDGQLAKLAPEHTAVVQVRRDNIYARQLCSRLPFGDWFWGFEINTGYRSGQHTIERNAVSNERMTGLFFTDVSYSLTNENRSRYYYDNENKGTWQLDFTIQNLFNDNTLTDNQLNNNFILLTEGIRNTRQAKVALSYTFGK